MVAVIKLENGCMHAKDVEKNMVNVVGSPNKAGTCRTP